MEIYKYKNIDEANVAIKNFEESGFNVNINKIDDKGYVYIIIDGSKKFKK